MQPNLPRWRAQGVEVLLVCQEREAVLDFLRRYGLQIPALLDIDGSAGRAYGVAAIPYTVWVDKEGTVEKTTVGWRREHLAEFDKLASLLSR